MHDPVSDAVGYSAEHVVIRISPRIEGAWRTHAATKGRQSAQPTDDLPDARMGLATADFS